MRENLPKEIAQRGYLIEGYVVQAFDAVKRQPEIIEAIKVYVGDGGPRRFVIARDLSEYDERARGELSSSCDIGVLSKAGERLEIFVLHPRPN
ncbi:MAG: hypothetical protein EOP50_10515, partial [Sphingobacteriales bacterium]